MKIATWKLWYEDQNRLLIPKLTVECFPFIYQILKSPPGRFDPKTLFVPAYSGMVHLFFGTVSKWDFISVLQKVLMIYEVHSHWLQSALRLTFFLSSLPVEKLQSLSDEEWTVFLLQLCSSLGEQNPSAHLSTSSTARPPPSTAIRSRLHLLCYLCSVVGHKVIANRLINSTLVGNYLRYLLKSCWNHYWLGLTRSFCSLMEYLRLILGIEVVK